MQQQTPNWINEEWKSIPGFNYYEASSFGRIRNITSKRVLSPRITGGRPEGRYHYVTLSQDGERKSIPVHRLIAMTFIGEIPEKMVVAHLDHNPANNRVSNLKICTQSENVKANVRTSGHKKRDIFEIAIARALYENRSWKLSYEFLADVFDVTPSTIYKWCQFFDMAKSKQEAILSEQKRWQGVIDSLLASMKAADTRKIRNIYRLVDSINNEY